MIDFLVVHEENDLLGLEHLLTQLSGLSNHGYQKRVIGLIDKSLDVLELLVALLLDVVLHLVGNQAACYAVSH